MRKLTIRKRVTGHPLYASEGKPSVGCAHVLVVCCRSRRAPLGLEKRGRSLSQKGRGVCVARDLASRDNSLVTGRKRDERTSGVGRVPAAKSGDRSWEAPEHRGRDLFVDGRLFGSLTPRDLHGHAGETASAISTRSARAFARVGTTRSDRRVSGSARGVVTQSSNRHGPKRPTTRLNPDGTPKRIGHRETPDCSSGRARASVATRVENPRDAGARSR